jgi:hypothetical protein
MHEPKQYGDNLLVLLKKLNNLADKWIVVESQAADLSGPQLAVTGKLSCFRRECPDFLTVRPLQIAAILLRICRYSSV